MRISHLAAPDMLKEICMMKLMSCELMCREKPVLSLNQYDHSIVTGDGSVELIHSSRISNIGCICGSSCGPGFMRIEQVTVACSRFLV
jgi:hypothetical protein